MTIHLCTTQEKLDEIERLIITERKFAGMDVYVLKAIAADLRARLEGTPSAALADVERRVVAVARSRSPRGYDPAKLHVLGEGVAVHWPVIKQALEKFGAQVEGGMA